MLHSTRLKKDRGFSLIEMIIVAVIIMILAAITVPRILNTISDAKLRYFATNYTGLLQSARMQAVRKRINFYQRQLDVHGQCGVGGFPGLQCTRTPLYRGREHDHLPIFRSGLRGVYVETLPYRKSRLGFGRHYPERTHADLDLRRQWLLDTTGLRNKQNV